MRTGTAWRGWAAAALVTLALGTARAAGLSLGDEAPELDVTEWVQGDAVVLAENPAKHVRIVQFFNSYDQGCAEAAKDLEKLHTELGPKGVDLIAVTTQSADAAREFIEKRKLTYRVAVDQYNNTNAVFMKGVGRLPFAFVVDATNRIAWMGAPDEGLRKVVEEVLAGTYDVDKARKTADLRNKLYQTLQRQKPDEIAKAADALLAVEPSDNVARSVRMQIFQTQDDRDGYLAWMRDYAKQQNDDAETLSWVAWRLAGGDVAWRDIALANDASARAVELTESKNADVLDTRSWVLFGIGLIDEAIEAAKASLAIEETDGTKARLAHYEACLELQKKLKAAGGKKDKPAGGKKKR